MSKTDEKQPTAKCDMAGVRRSLFILVDPRINNDIIAVFNSREEAKMHRKECENNDWEIQEHYLNQDYA